MTYRVIGVMSGSSLDGLDITFVEFQEISGSWSYSINAAETRPYSPEWVHRLKNAVQLNALDYLLLDAEYGHYIGEQVLQFMEAFNLHYKVQLIASHGHTSFHYPAKKMTAQLGDGAAIAAKTGLNVVSNLRAMDVALGGEGAPIVPIGEQLLFEDYPFLLNIGGIANVSAKTPDGYIGFDICAANRVLNMLANQENLDYDKGGQLAEQGTVHLPLLQQLNQLDYFSLPFPKSLSNDFGIEVVYPLIQQFQLPTKDGMATCCAHIAFQVKDAVAKVLHALNNSNVSSGLLITGGGAHNHFLVKKIAASLAELGITAEVPDKNLVDFKEALVMALIGILRWREQNNVLHSVTGASRSSIGGAVWIGQEA